MNSEELEKRMSEQDEKTVQQNENTGKTFTQDELEHIIGERLAREKAKYADYDALKEKADAYDKEAEEKKSEFEKAVERAEKAESELELFKKAKAINDAKNKIASEYGIDASVLRGNNEEEIKSHAESIKKLLSNVPGYPVIHDNGEIPTPTLTKEEILSIKDDKARRKAIKENISLWQ